MCVYGLDTGYQSYFYFPHQFLKGSNNGLLFSPVAVVERDLLTEIIRRNRAFFFKNTSGDKQPDKEMEAHGYIPVSDETRVDISVLPSYFCSVMVILPIGLRSLVRIRPENNR